MSIVNQGPIPAASTTWRQRRKAKRPIRNLRAEFSKLWPELRTDSIQMRSVTDEMVAVVCDGFSVEQSNFVIAQARKRLVSESCPFEGLELALHVRDNEPKLVADSFWSRVGVRGAKLRSDWFDRVATFENLEIEYVANRTYRIGTPSGDVLVKADGLSSGLIAYGVALAAEMYLSVKEMLIAAWSAGCTAVKSVGQGWVTRPEGADFPVAESVIIVL